MPRFAVNLYKRGISLYHGEQNAIHIRPKLIKLVYGKHNEEVALWAQKKLIEADLKIFSHWRKPSQEEKEELFAFVEQLNLEFLREKR